VLPSGGIVRALAFSPESKTLASGSGDFSVRIWGSLSAHERAKREAR
jgi:WD40 repeat protein